MSAQARVALATKIHPTAIIAAGARIASDVEVGPYSVIGPDVVLGAGCRIGSHVVIEGHTSIGSETVVYQFASLGSTPQDLKYRGEASKVVIGERNVIREYVTIQPGTSHGHMATMVGDNNLFMAFAHVAHDCIVGDNNIFANGATLAGHVTIGNNVILGGLVAIHQFSRIGDYVILGGGAMVDRDVPPYCIAQGDRASLRGVNVIALERAGFTPTEIKNVRRVYRTLFAGKKTTKFQDRINALSAELVADPRVDVLLKFLQSSQRGFVKTRRGFDGE